jgi:hypothetical protein
MLGRGPAHGYSARGLAGRHIECVGHASQLANPASLAGPCLQCGALTRHSHRAWDRCGGVAAIGECGTTV